MKRCSLFSLVPVLFAALAVPTLAHADRFTLSGSGPGDLSAPLPCFSVGQATFFCPPSFPGTISYSGTLDIDTTTFLATSANITATKYPVGSSYSFVDKDLSDSVCASSSSNSSCVGGGDTMTRLYDSTGQKSITISFGDPIVGPYLGGSVSLSFSGVSGSGIGTLTRTDLAPAATPTAAATPEPSSLLLLGTGVLGLAGAARRRFLA